VLFQELAHDASVIPAIRVTGIDPTYAKVLDVGCGVGGSLINFLRLGFCPNNLWGIDINKLIIEKALLTFFNINFVCGDASNMNFEDKTFDIVVGSTILC
jgi:ubiquinone/menaquinone biosynthesis C-methylase UbiE